LWNMCKGGTKKGRDKQVTKETTKLLKKNVQMEVG
jgi:hypothetical protein